RQRWQAGDLVATVRCVEQTYRLTLATIQLIDCREFIAMGGDRKVRVRSWAALLDAVAVKATQRAGGDDGIARSARILRGDLTGVDSGGPTFLTSKLPRITNNVLPLEAAAGLPSPDVPTCAT